MSLKKFALVAALSAFAAPAFAAECSTVLEANDAMQYNKKKSKSANLARISQLNLNM